VDNQLGPLPLQTAEDKFPVQQVTLVKYNLRPDILNTAGAEVVQHRHCGTSGQQGVHNVGADKPGPAGN